MILGWVSGSPPRVGGGRLGGGAGARPPPARPPAETRAGAAGNSGAEAGARAEPDGYTLLSAPPPPLVINQNLYPKLGFDPSEFVPIVVMVRVPNSLVVTPNFP